MTDFYTETNSTEATRSIRNRLRGLAQSATDDQLLLLQALVMGQPNVTRRQAVEWFIARRVVTALIDAGYEVSVNDGEVITVERSRDVNQITGALMTVDEEHLMVHRPGDQNWKITEGSTTVKVGASAWVFLVYGNDGWDVVSDYTTNLEDVLRPVFDLIGEIEP